MLIQPLGFEAPVAEAAKELAAYLSRLAPVEAVALPELPMLPADSKAEVVLGVASRLMALTREELPAVSALDDALAIVPEGERLYLAGANPRSVLFAVYRLLEELGVVFLRPGPGGEIVPRLRKLEWPAEAIREAASYRHRGLCMEGWPRLEHCLGLLDWMVKKKMNSFHIEFLHGGVYWERGYKQTPEMDPSLKKYRFSDAECELIDDRIFTRAKQLGMVFHRGGHGWTAATLGYRGVDWNAPPDHPLDPAKRDWIAQVNGKREFWRNEPTNTELCYSNPEVREAFLATVMEYAKRHQETEVLHVWLSDATNNHCECAGCREKQVAEWYALLINELGRRIRAAGLTTRIVFLSYFDTLWPPEREAFRGDNLVFMYAPISRCYRHGLADAKCVREEDQHDPELNRVETPRGNRASAEIARRWRAANRCDSFVFEYYRWAPTWKDGMGLDVGDVVAQDMKDLRSLGLNGVISNDCIRAFYPMPYSANAMADFLWDKSRSIPDYRSEQMRATFGKHAAKVEGYFSGMVAAFTLGESYEHKTVLEAAGPERRARLRKIALAGDAARRDFLARARTERNASVKLSLELIALHAEQMARVARIHLAAGKPEQVAKLRARWEARLPQVLARYGPWVDLSIRNPVREALWDQGKSQK